MDQAPCGLGVVEVEVGELLAPVLGGVVPPTALPGDAVAGADLVGVLAVAQVLHPLGGDVQGRGQDLAVLLVEPGHDGGVVGRGVGEGGPGQPTASGVAQAPLRPQLLQHVAVRRWVDHDPDMRVVLGRRPHHGGPADVDQLDAGLAGERVEVGHDQVDRGDVPGLEVGHVVGVRPIGQDPAVDLGVQGLDPAPEHLGGIGDPGHFDNG